MQDSDLFDQIMAKLRTTAECAQVIVCLEECSVPTFFSMTNTQKELIFRKLPIQTIPFFIEAFGKTSITAEEQIVLKRQINTLLDKFRTCKNVKLIIAFRPNEETISFFSDWIKKNVKANLLIDLQFDKAIVGGAQIVASGMYKDYSVKKKLADRFQIQREEIMDLLN